MSECAKCMYPGFRHGDCSIAPCVIRAVLSSIYSLKVCEEVFATLHACTLPVMLFKSSCFILSLYSADNVYPGEWVRWNVCICVFVHCMHGHVYSEHLWLPSYYNGARLTFFVRTNLEKCSADAVEVVSRSGWSVAVVLGLMRSSLSVPAGVPSCTTSPVLAGVKDTAWSVEDNCPVSTTGVDVPEHWLLKFNESIGEGVLTTAVFLRTPWISANHLKLTVISRSLTFSSNSTPTPLRLRLNNFFMLRLQALYFFMALLEVVIVSLPSQCLHDCSVRHSISYWSKKLALDRILTLKGQQGCYFVVTPQSSSLRHLNSLSHLG